jgi:hypothetical protein
MALALVFFPFLITHFPSTYDTHRAVHLYSNGGCSDPTNTLNTTPTAQSSSNQASGKSSSFLSK